MSQTAETVTPFPARLRTLASGEPTAPVLTHGDVTLTRAELVSAAERTARQLIDSGVSVGDYVSIVLPNGIDAVVAMFGCWFAGAVPQALSPKLAPIERQQIVELTAPAAVIGTELVDGADVPLIRLEDADDASTAPLPDEPSPSWKAPTSGGSTGRPKVIVATQPAVWEAVAGFADLLGVGGVHTALITAPLSHNGPFISTALAILGGGHAVVMSRFDAEETLALTQQHRVTWIYAVPTMMVRILKLPDDVRAAYDLSSVRSLLHLAAPCPPTVKQAFIDWLGAERILELYAGTEVQAGCVISGTEWLTHRGSVGKPVLGEIDVRDDDGKPLPAGQIGRIWMRRGPDAPPPYRYLGATAVTAADGWESLGDMGHVDAEGYVYLADRDSDMILVGGSNVYPAEVEAALLEHEAVSDACVIGLPHDELGSVPHAIVRVTDAVSVTELQEFAAFRLAAYKRPRTVEFVDEPLRDDAGKVRRSALRAVRIAQTVG